MKKEVSEENKKEIEKIIKPEIEKETIITSVVKNKTQKSFPQFKVTIPRKFAGLLKIDKDTHNAVFTIEKNKNNGKITYVLTARIEGKQSA